MNTFTGFTPTLAFLKDIESNNHRDWFETHKDRYQKEYLPPIQAFIEAIDPHLKEISPGLQADPRPSGGSIMRIFRDTRFSKDKTPYKTWLGITFWEGDGKPRESPGFHFNMANDGAFIYAGMHSFPKETLTRYRRAVDDERRGMHLQAALAAAAAGDYELGGEQYARVPEGYDPAHPRADLLRCKGLLAKSSRIPVSDLNSPALVGICLGHFHQTAPLHHWLVEMHSSS